jgi:hypothetical protein
MPVFGSGVTGIDVAGVEAAVALRSSAVWVKEGSG